MRDVGIGGRTRRKRRSDGIRNVVEWRRRIDKDGEKTEVAERSYSWPKDGRAAARERSWRRWEGGIDVLESCRTFRGEMVLETRFRWR